MVVVVDVAVVIVVDVAVVIVVKVRVSVPVNGFDAVHLKHIEQNKIIMISKKEGGWGWCVCVCGGGSAGEQANRQNSKLTNIHTRVSK